MDDPANAVPETATPVVDQPADGTAAVVADPPVRRRLRLGTVALATALVVAAGVAVSQVQRAGDAQDELDQVTDVREAAAAFGAAYLTYDAADVKASSQRLLELATEEFGAEFEESRTPGIEALFDQIGTKTTATATGVYVSDISGDEARALVVVDVVASSAETPDQRLVDLTFLLDLVIEDGEWKVEAVNPAPRPDVVGGPTTTSPATPPTTAPTTTVPGG